MKGQQKYKWGSPPLVRTENRDGLASGNTEIALTLLHAKTGGIYDNFDRIPVYVSQPVVQTKVQVIKLFDAAEKQADGMAEKVVQPYSDHTLFSPVQTNRENGTPLRPESTNKIISSGRGGRSLSKNVNEYMSGRFGLDFSKAKIHAASEAANVNLDLDARAFTSGSNIYFNRGEYKPHSDDGKQLLAHKLTHVAQQAGESTIRCKKPEKPVDTKVEGEGVILNFRNDWNNFFHLIVSFLKLVMLASVKV